jgi:hypothetical protein
MPSRTKKVKEDEERSHNELRQLFIDKYRKGHFDSIKSVEKVLEECQKLLKESEKRGDQKRFENLIKGTEKALLKLRKKTPQILKEADRMQKQLDSLK